MTQLVSLPDATQHRRIALALAKVPSLLTSGEVAACTAVQLPAAAYVGLSRRQIVVATNQRLVIIKRNVLGGFTMSDIQWQDLVDARVNERLFATVFGCEFVARTKKGTFVVNGLPSTQAFNLYRFCQEREQEWREKNRVREMEESRARAGGIVVGAGARGAGASAGAGDMMVQLQQLQQLRQIGTVNDVEFESMKAKILTGM